MTSASKSAVVRQLKPLLAVSDIQRSVEFYKDRLGFTLTGEAENEGKMLWCRMERGGSAIMLQQNLCFESPVASGKSG
jgi:catechol 2,3-dioxygenase-like lactoylglutathione lyase family enzyme